MPLPSIANKICASFQKSKYPSQWTHQENKNILCLKTCGGKKTFKYLLIFRRRKKVPINSTIVSTRILFSKLTSVCISNSFLMWHHSSFLCIERQEARGSLNRLLFVLFCFICGAAERSRYKRCCSCCCGDTFHFYWSIQLFCVWKVANFFWNRSEKNNILFWEKSKTFFKKDMASQKF